MFQYRHDGTFTAKIQHSGISGAGFVRIHSVRPLGKAALFTFLVMTAVYFAYRIPLWNPQAPVMSSLLLAAEIFGTVTLLLHVFATWSLIERRAPEPPEGFEADIFITTWNESAEILRHTLLAAKQVSHARAVWLLDDGCRAEMKELAAELGVKYIAREDRSHAKAGNLNNALGQSDAPFVAIFDCDHAPSPDFLERTLGYFLDPSVSFVQTPQDFYNVDSFQHRGSAATREAWHEQTLFYRVIQPGKDRWNATFFCGSCSIMRREALEDIGGFATGTITEDMHTSLRLHKNGWSAVYHPEALAFGMSPVNLEQYETQRLRWGRGAMQVWAKEAILSCKNLSWAQRIAYFTSTITYFEGWQKAIVYILPIVVLTTGRMPIIWTGWTFIGLFLGWLLSGAIVNEVFSRGYAKTVWMEEYNFLRFYTFMKATLALIIPIKWRFSVTPKTMGDDLRLPMRLWPQISVAVAAIGSMLFGSWLYFRQHHLPEGAFISNMVWAGIVAALSIKTLHFVSGRLRQRRSDHRFVVPLVARVRTGSGLSVQERYAIAEDVSSQGMNLTVDGKLPMGGWVRGNLMLPAGPISFNARVIRFKPSPDGRGQSIALRFEWRTPGEADFLNKCLYGNSLQWDINGWAEVRKRPWLSFWKKDETPDGRWQFGQVMDGTDSALSCLVREEKGAFRVLSYSAFPSTAHLSLKTDKNQSAHSELQVAGYREYHVGGSPVHMAVLANGRDCPALFHREPTWIAEAAA